MTSNNEELTNLTQHHTPNQDRAVRHAAIREAANQFMQVVGANVVRGPELSHALARAQEAMFWANAGIAREADHG